jgi:hypothetical protein
MISWQRNAIGRRHRLDGRAFSVSNCPRLAKPWSDHRRIAMSCRGSTGTIAIAVLLTSIAVAEAFDDAKYPDLSGQWLLVRPPVGGQPPFDPTKPWGKGQQAPLTPEYQAVLEASIADQANGGQGNWHSGGRCMPPGMPGMMNGYGDLEIIVQPEITYFLIEHNIQNHRRIHTDGRDWPKEVELSYRGYSIGKWIDENGDGQFDVLQVETRHFRGTRALDPAGMPVHSDNQSIVKERIYYDKATKYLHDEITLIDHAFTRPWTVLKTIRVGVRKIAQRSPPSSRSATSFISRAPTASSCPPVGISRHPI